jgi:hypothetical protein
MLHKFTTNSSSSSSSPPLTPVTIALHNLLHPPEQFEVESPYTSQQRNWSFTSILVVLGYTALALFVIGASLYSFGQNFSCNLNVVRSDLRPTFPSFSFSEKGPDSLAFTAAIESGLMNFLITLSTYYEFINLLPFLRKAIRNDIYGYIYLFVIVAAILSSITPGYSAATEIIAANGSLLHAGGAIAGSVIGNLSPNTAFGLTCVSDFWNPRSAGFWIQNLLEVLSYKLGSLAPQTKKTLFIRELNSLKNALKMAQHPAKKNVLESIQTIIAKFQRNEIIEAAKLISTLPLRVQLLFFGNMAIELALTEPSKLRDWGNYISLGIQIFAMIIALPVAIYSVGKPLAVLMSSLPDHWAMTLLRVLVVGGLTLWSLIGNLSSYRSGAKFAATTIMNLPYMAQRQWFSTWQQKLFTLLACIVVFYPFGWSSAFCGTHASATATSAFLGMGNNTLYNHTGLSISPTIGDAIITGTSLAFFPFPGIVNVLVSHLFFNFLAAMLLLFIATRLIDAETSGLRRPKAAFEKFCFGFAKTQTELDAYSNSVVSTMGETLYAHPWGSDEYNQNMRDVAEIAQACREKDPSFRNNHYELCGFFGVGNRQQVATERTTLISVEPETNPFLVPVSSYVTSLPPAPAGWTEITI